MPRIKSLVRVLLPASVALAVLNAISPMETSVPQPWIGRQVAQLSPQDTDLDTVVPDGVKLTYDEFKKKAGDDVANLLSPLGPKTITRNGQKYTLECAGKTIQTSGVTVYVDTTVSCDASNSGKVVTLKNIKGISVKVDYLGKLQVKEAVITPTGGNKARVDVKVEVSRWLPWVSYSYEVDLDSI
ncbi:MAG: hypothetical protein K2Z81_00360 [Cyanobacteria bacterium]|nr:hypothetical protein [Cyanobacteriota bacterium]